MKRFSSVFLLAVVFLRNIPFSVSLNDNAESERPIIQRPDGTSYKIVLTIDGGALRGILSGIVLAEFEDNIKRHILTYRSDLLPKDMKVKSISDFEIHLGDFVDYIAGTSSGSWFAFYLASRGGTDRVVNLLQNRRIVEQYGEVSPGSMRGLVVLMIEFSSGRFAQPETPPMSSVSINSATPPPGVLTPLLDPSGVSQFVDFLFGNMTLSDLRTSCIVPSFDLISRSSMLFMYDEFDSPPSVSYTEQIRHTQPTHYRSSDIRRNYGVDFLLRDVAIGSGSLPTALPAHELFSISEIRRRFLLVDGNMMTNSPTFSALIQVANATGDTSFSRIAVISVGSGIGLPNLADNAQGGGEQWDTSRERTYYLTNIIPELRSKQLDLLFSANSRVKPGQYFRIQPIGQHGTELSRILQVGLSTNNTSGYSRVGDELAATYNTTMQTFIKHFIFS